MYVCSMASNEETREDRPRASNEEATEERLKRRRERQMETVEQREARSINPLKYNYRYINTVGMIHHALHISYLYS